MEQRDLADAAALIRKHHVVEALEALVDRVIRLVEVPGVWPARQGISISRQSDWQPPAAVHNTHASRSAWGECCMSRAQ